MLVLVLSASCVSVQGGQYPTVAPGWHLFTDLRAGYALALPSTWSGFAADQLESMQRACSAGAEGQAARASASTELVRRGAVVIACDTARAADIQVPIAYAIRSAAPPEGLDQYVANAPQDPGRVLMKEQRLKVNAGEMIVRHVHERFTLSNGTAHDIMQYQYLVVKYGQLHILFVEFPTALEESIGEEMDRMGTSLTPTH